MGAWEDLSDQFIRMVLMMILVDGGDDIIDDGIGDDDYHEDDGGYALWVDLDLSDHFILIILVMV